MVWQAHHWENDGILVGASSQDQASVMWWTLGHGDISLMVFHLRIVVLSWGLNTKKHMGMGQNPLIPSPYNVGPPSYKLVYKPQ